MSRYKVIEAKNDGFFFSIDECIYCVKLNPINEIIENDNFKMI